MAKSKQKPKHIAVAGNIGAGKTTLTELLSKHYKWIPQFEDVEHNPYLMDFYEDMPRWSFNLQIYFLNSRLNHLLEIKRGREYEENIRLDYLKKLNELYRKWIESYKEGPLLIIDVDKNNFSEREEDLGEVISKV